MGDAFTTAAAKAVGASALKDKIGAELAGSVLTCRVCADRRTVTAAEVSRFGRVGWPRCCNETMSLHREEPQ